MPGWVTSAASPSGTDRPRPPPRRRRPTVHCRCRTRWRSRGSSQPGRAPKVRSVAVMRRPSAAGGPVVLWMLYERTGRSLAERRTAGDSGGYWCGCSGCRGLPPRRMLEMALEDRVCKYNFAEMRGPGTLRRYGTCSLCLEFSRTENALFDESNCLDLPIGRPCFDMSA